MAKNSIQLLLLIGLGCFYSLSANAETEQEILQKAVKVVVEKTNSSIVRIDTLGDLNAEFRAPRNAMEARNGVIAKRGFKQAYGPSTGVIISSDGYILSSVFPFKRKPRHIIVTLADDSQYIAKLVAEDDLHGLALLKIEATSKLTAINFQLQQKTRPGQYCVAIGRGYGAKSANISVGIVSALNRMSGKALQTSALISPANFGGVLVDFYGKAIGVIVPLSQSGRMAGVDLYDSGIGFAIPAHLVVRLIPKLKAGKNLAPAFLGVVVDRTKTSGGVALAEVARRSPAEKAGLRKGDTITALNGEVLNSYFDFYFALGRETAGSTVSLKILRDGVERQLTVTLGKRPTKGGDFDDDIAPGTLPGADKPEDKAKPDHNHEKKNSEEDGE